MNNSRFVREYHRCFEPLPWCSNIPRNCVLIILPEFSSIDLGMPYLTTVRLGITRKFYQNDNLSWIIEESCSNAILTLFSMNKKPTNLLLWLGRNVFGHIGHCAIRRHLLRTHLLSNDFCRMSCFTVIHFFCQCVPLFSEVQGFLVLQFLSARRGYQPLISRI